MQQSIFGIDDTDHKMVVADVPVDVAGVAKNRAKMWEVRKVKTHRWDCDDLGNMSGEKVDRFNEIAAATQPKGDINAKKIKGWLLKAGPEKRLESKKELETYERSSQES